MTIYRHHDHHDHGHEHHHHEHEHIGGAEALAILTYMLDHNRHHAEELHELCHKLEASGKNEAALLIDEAVERFNEGNVLLAAALEKLGQE